MKRIFLILLCFCVGLGVCGCAEKKNADDKKIDIVTTIFPLYDFARAVAADNADITMLIRPGTEVHSFDPKPSDIAAVYNCDLLLYIGGESDTWVNRVLADVNVNTLPLISAVEGIGESEEHKLSHHHSHEHSFDEHIWTNPANAAIMIEKICEQLSALDPDDKEIYRNNAENYVKKLKAVDDKIRNTVNLSEDKFILVADRFPFAYLAEYYGLDYEAAFGGCAVSSDISLKTMARLTDCVRQRGVKAAFYVEMSNKSIANALHEETGVELIELHSAHNVTLEDFNKGITYLEILENNASALERGLR